MSKIYSAILLASHLYLNLIQGVTVEKRRREALHQTNIVSYTERLKLIVCESNTFHH